MDSNSSGTKARTDGVGPPNIFEKLVSSIFGGDDPERQKRRQLKAIAKRLNKSRFKFYRSRQSLAQPGLGRFFFDIYKTVGPAQKLLQNARDSKALREIVIEHFFSDEQRAMRDNLTEDAIRELSHNKEAKELAKVIKTQLQQFYASFETGTVRRINESSQLLQRLLDFVAIDYFFILRKFDGSIPENGFNANPKFEAINATYLCDDLKDFLEVFEPLPVGAKWDDVLDILKEYRGMDVVDRSDWKKLMVKIARVRDSAVLTDIVRHAEEDPLFEADSRTVVTRSVEPYLEKTKNEAEAVIQSILSERRQDRINKILNQVFGTTAISRAKNYTEKNSASVALRASTSYRHYQSFNYLKAFLIDYFKRDIRELQDVLVVRGKWADSANEQEMANAFHRLMEISTEVIEFDDQLGTEGETGMKLKRALGRSIVSDPGSQKLALQAVEEINKRAESLINESAQKLIILGKSLKALIDDYGKKKHDLLMNWREIEGMTETPIDERMADVYKRIYYFIQLLQLFQKRKKQKEADVAPPDPAQSAEAAGAADQGE